MADRRDPTYLAYMDAARAWVASADGKAVVEGYHITDALYAAFYAGWRASRRATVSEGGFVMLCWHRWNKWSDPSNGIFANLGSCVGHFAVCQYRTCGKCGKAEVRKLPSVRSIEELRSQPLRGSDE